MTSERSYRSDFVGREPELQQLQDALSGQRAVVLIEGEAGVGKSRLLAELARVRPAIWATSLVGRCAPYRESLTLGPIIDAVRDAHPSVRELDLSALAGALRPVFPEWAADLPASPEPMPDVGASRHRLFRAFAELLEQLPASTLVVEDVHWADESTLEFLLFLTTRQTSKVSVLLTYRPDDLSPASLLYRLRAQTNGPCHRERIELACLEVADTGAMVQSMLDGRMASEDVMRDVHERTGGLPLAIEETMLLLRQRDDFAPGDGELIRLEVGNPTVPPTMRDLVLERLQRMPETARQVLRAVAVLVDPVEDAIVRQIAEVSDDDRGFAAALGSGLLVYDGQRIRFRHLLMAQTVCETMTRPELRNHHQRAAQVLETLVDVPLTGLIRHYREAGRLDKWSHYALVAADRAAVSNDYSTAVSVLTEVVRSDEIDRATHAEAAARLIDVAVARREGDDLVQHDAISALKEAAGPPGLRDEERADLRLGVGRLLQQAGAYERAYDEIESALPYLEYDPVKLARALTSLGLPMMGTRPARVHLRWLRRAAELEHQTRDDPEFWDLVVDRAAAMLMLGDAEGWAVFDNLPDNIGDAAKRRVLARGLANAAVAAMVWGLYPRARRYLAAARALADQQRHHSVLSNMEYVELELDWQTGLRAHVATRLGAMAPALALLGLSQDTLQARIHMAEGAWKEAEERLRAVHDRSLRLGVMIDVVDSAALLAVVHLQHAEPEQAVVVTSEPMRVLRENGHWIWGTDLLLARVRALVAVGEIEEAADLVSQFTTGLQSSSEAQAVAASVQTARAFVTKAEKEFSVAQGLFDAAATAWDTMPRPHEALLAREQVAECLIESGEHERGLRVLSDVAAGLVDLAARYDADRVARRLREMGAPAPRPWKGGRRGYGNELSPRERDVVRLVAAGMTNRETARALSRSPNTVATQLRSAMRKLAVRSRAALALKAAELNLLAE